MDCTQLMVGHDKAMVGLGHTMAMLNLALASSYTQALVMTITHLSPSRDKERSAGMKRTTQEFSFDMGISSTVRDVHDEEWPRGGA